MPIPVYILKDNPQLGWNESDTQPFREFLPDWRAAGLGPIVEHVTGNGTIVRQDDGRRRLVVWPEDQEYPACEPTTVIEIDDELSIGWAGLRPPGPDDLDNGNPLRLQTCGVMLADGNIWQVPEVRERGTTRLPTDLVRDRRTGALRNPLKREYVDLWNESEYWFDLLLEGDGTIEWVRALQYATSLLSLRYRFCDATQAALRVIDSTNVFEIIKASLSWHAVLAYAAELAGETPQKKSPGPRAVTLSGNSGLEASGPTTAQLEVSSGSLFDTPAANDGGG